MPKASAGSRTASERRTISWTRTIGTLAAVVWITSTFYMWHFGRSWHLDLRVYRAATRSLLDHGSPFLSRFTSDHLPFTYTPFALLVLIPLSFGSLGLIEGAWWLVNSAALVVTLYLLISRRRVAAHRVEIRATLPSHRYSAVQQPSCSNRFGATWPMGRSTCS